MMMMEKQPFHNDFDFKIFDENEEKIKNKVSGSRTGAIITNSVKTDENEIEESDDFSNKVKIPSNFNVTPFSKKYLLPLTPDQTKSKILSNSQMGVQQDFNVQIEEEEEEKEEVSFVDSKIDQNQRHTLIEFSPIKTENHANSMIDIKLNPIKTPAKLTSKSVILRQSRKGQIESISSDNDVIEAVHNARINTIQPPVISPFKAPEVENLSPKESKTNDQPDTLKKYPIFVDQATVPTKKSIETSPFKKPLSNQVNEKNESYTNEFNFNFPFEQNQTQQNVKLQPKLIDNSANVSTKINNKNNSIFRTDLQQAPFEKNEENQIDSQIEKIFANKQQQPQQSFTKNRNFYSSRLKDKSFDDEIPKINRITMDLYDESKNDHQFDEFDRKEEPPLVYTQKHNDSKKRSYRYKYRENSSSDEDTSYASSLNDTYTAQSPIISHYSPYRSKPENEDTKELEKYFIHQNNSRENITIKNRFNQSNSINIKDEDDYFNDYKPAPIELPNDESENQKSYNFSYDNQRKSNRTSSQKFARPRQKNILKPFQTVEDSSTSDDDEFLEIENEKNKDEHLDQKPKNDNITKKIQEQKRHQVKRISFEDDQEQNSDDYSEEDNFKKKRSNSHNKFFSNRNNSIVKQKSAKRLHRNENIKINQDYDEKSYSDSDEFTFTPPIEQNQNQNETQQQEQFHQQFQFQQPQQQYQFQQPPPQQQFMQEQSQFQQGQPQQQYQFQQPQQQFLQGQYQPQFQFQQPQQQFLQGQPQQQYQFQQPQQQQFLQDQQQSQFQQKEQPQQKEDQTELQEEQSQQKEDQTDLQEEDKQIQSHPQIELEISQSQSQQQFQESNNDSENEINKETEKEKTGRKEIKLEPFFDTLVNEAPEFRPSTPNISQFKYTALNQSPIIETPKTKSFNDDSHDQIQTDQHFTNDESIRVTNKPYIKRISRGPEAIKSGIFNFNIDKSYTINDDDKENEHDSSNEKIGSELLSQIKTPKSILKKRSEDSGLKTENFNTPVKKLRFEKPKDGRQIPHLPISPLPDVNKLMTPVQSKAQNQEDESSDEILFRDSFINSSMPNEEIFRYEDEKQDFSSEYPFNSFATPPRKSLTLAEMEQNSIKKVKHRHHRRHRSKQNEDNENEKDDEDQISEEKKRQELERLEQEEKRIKKLEEEEEEARKKQEEEERIKLEQEKLRLEEEKQKKIQEKEEMLKQEEQRIKMEQERLKKEEERLKQQEEMQKQRDEELQQKVKQKEQPQNDESNNAESETAESAPQSFEEMHNNSFPDYPTISQNSNISSTTSSSPPHSENQIESHSSIVDVSAFHQFNSPSPPPPINDDFNPPALLSSQNSDDEIINDQQQQLPPTPPFSSQKAEATPPKAKPKKNQKIRKTEVNSNEKYDPSIDDLPIALRRTMRPKTQPLRHWMNEKIIYKPAENGCFTQYAVQTDLQNSDYINPLSTSGAQTIESIIEENQRIKNERNKRKNSSSLKNDSEVIPKRIIPGIENPSSSIISFKGIEKRTLKSNEIEILPQKSLELDAAQKKIMVVFSGGNAARIEYKNGKKWKIRAGGQAYICKGDLATITNLSNEESVHLFVIYN